MDWKNKLYFGDNLGIFREHAATESVDLIYLDPPFNSSATYNVPFKEKSGEGSASCTQVFAVGELLEGKKTQVTEHQVRVFAKAEWKT